MVCQSSFRFRVYALPQAFLPPPQAVEFFVGGGVVEPRNGYFCFRNNSRCCMPELDRFWFSTHGSAAHRGVVSEWWSVCRHSSALSLRRQLQKGKVENLFNQRNRVFLLLLSTGKKRKISERSCNFAYFLVVLPLFFEVMCGAFSSAKRFGFRLCK